MGDKKKSWGKANTAPKHTKVITANARSGEWSMDRLLPMESKKTQVNVVSYSGMTILYRHGKK